MKKMICILLALWLMGVNIYAAPSMWAEESIEKAETLIDIPDEFYEDWKKAITRKEFAELSVKFTAHNLDYELEEFFEYVKNSDYMVKTTRVDGAVSSEKKVEGEKFEFIDCDNRFVLLAAEMGVVNGVGGLKFEPDRSITREEAAVMLYRVRALCSNELSRSNERFDDYSDVSSWAEYPVRHMKASGVMQGVEENLFAPKQTYTREMAVVTFMRQSELSQKDGIYEKKPTVENLCAYYDEHPIYAVKEMIKTDYGTLLVVVSGGAMHTGGQTLIFVTNDFKKLDFSKNVPYETPWGQAHYETMELSEDGQKLVYTYSFDNEAVFGTDINNPDMPARVLHKKGQYVFTADLKTGEVTYVINDLK